MRQAVAQRTWMEALARAGYVTKGIVYVLVGGLAVAAATGHGGAIGGQRTAVRVVTRAPYGDVLLVLIAVGLFAYAAWRFAQALLDPERVGTSPKGLLERAGNVLSGALHVFLGITAFQAATGHGTGDSGRTYLARILASESIGPLVVCLAGVGVLLYSALELHRALTLDFTRNLEQDEIGRAERKLIAIVGRVGLTARAVVFIIVGIGLVRAALTDDAWRAETIDSAMREIASQRSGVVLLFTVAVGLCAYGVHSFVQARYRRIPT